MMNISVSIGLNGTPHGNAKQLWPAKSLHGQSLQSAPIIVDQTEAPVFSTVSRVVMWAKDAFSQTLVFLPSAIKGAANSPFRNTGKLVQLFKALHQVATDMRMDGVAGWRMACTQPWLKKVSRTNHGYHRRLLASLSTTTPSCTGGEGSCSGSTSPSVPALLTHVCLCTS